MIAAHQPGQGDTSINPREAREERASMVRRHEAELRAAWHARPGRIVDPVLLVAHMADPVARDLLAGQEAPIVIAVSSAAALAMSLDAVNPKQAALIAREKGERPFIVAIGWWGTSVGCAAAFGLDLDVMPWPARASVGGAS